MGSHRSLLTDDIVLCEAHKGVHCHFCQGPFGALYRGVMGCGKRHSLPWCSSGTLKRGSGFPRGMGVIRKS